VFNMTNKSISLGGVWKIVKDDMTSENKEVFYNQIPDKDLYNIEIPGNVPSGNFFYNYMYSNIFSMHHGYVWYYKTFEYDFEVPDGEYCRIEFENAGYVCEVWVNGIHIGENRQHSKRFSFDITKALKKGGENLIAVRCFEPIRGGKRIDGIVLSEIPNGSLGLGDPDDKMSCAEPIGGILDEVRLVISPFIRIDDVYVKADFKTGHISTEITVINDSGTESDIQIAAKVSEHKTGYPVSKQNKDVKLHTGKNVIEITDFIKNHKLWEIENPALYIMDVELSNGHSLITRFGFKELCIKDGFFFLNGKRILLKCAHSYMNAKTSIQMKAMGFNATRSIHRTFYREALDVCDEIGMLVIESPESSWGMTMHENTQQLIKDYMENMIVRDRNHVCIGAFYIFNELKNKEIMRFGAELLPELRKLDKEHMFMLSSARWDGDLSYGSISNPGSDEWNVKLGAEGNVDYPYKENPKRIGSIDNLGGLGDLHPYPNLPLNKETKNWFRTIGHDTNPVLISETGIGTQDDAMRWYLESLCGCVSAGSEFNQNCLKKVWAETDEFISENGFGGIFPFASDLCKAANRLNGRQRQMMFDLIRSNPKINGYSLTSWGIGNEGTLEGWNVIKENVAYAIQEGWTPLRWAVFSSDRTVYADRNFEIEAVLCNEDILKPGKYLARATVKGSFGVVWDKTFYIDYPENGFGNMPPLAATVFKESFSLPADDYIFTIRLLEGGAPYGGELKVKVHKPDADKAKNKKVTVLGLEEKTLKLLSDNGIYTEEFSNDNLNNTVIVGANFDRTDKNIWNGLSDAAKKGANVIFINSSLFADETASEYLKEFAGENARAVVMNNWLYHVDVIHIKHPVFDFMADEGIVDMEIFGDVYPITSYMDVKRPDKTISAGIQTDTRKTLKCMSVAEYNIGLGKYIINDFRIEETSGRHPFAEQLLLNFIAYY